MSIFINQATRFGIPHAAATRGNDRSNIIVLICYFGACPFPGLRSSRAVELDYGPSA